MQKREINMLYNEDCLNVLISLEDNTIDMVYLDPPFFLKRYKRLETPKVSNLSFLMYGILVMHI